MGFNYTDSEIQSAINIFNNLPDYVCWKNTDLEYVMLNDMTARMFGFESSRISYQHVSDYDLKCDAVNLADDFRRDDQCVLETGKDLTLLEYCKYDNNEWKLLFGRKSLLIDDQNQKKGIYARFIEVTDFPILRMMHGLISCDQQHLGIKNNTQNQVNYIVKDQFDDFGLTARESEIIFYLIRGKTAKEIARSVGLSFRTVEKHLGRIKNKLDCFSKSQLIEKAIALGIGSYLPRSKIIM